MSNPIFICTVNGKDYSGWKSGSISRSIENISGRFNLNITDMVRGQQLPIIRRDDRVKVSVRPQPNAKPILLLDGWVDKVAVKVGRTVSFKIVGRDLAGDLVDSDIFERGEWKGLKFEQFVQDLVSDYGIKVVVQAGLDTGDPIPNVKYDQGTKIYEVIAKYAQQKRLLCYSLADGRILIARASEVVSNGAFVEGGNEGNILEYSHDSNGTKLFSEYKVKGSHPVQAGETEAEAAQVEGEAKDTRQKRLRRLLIIPDSSQRRVSAQDRAEWEMQTRRADAESYSVKINGWQPVLNVLALLKLPSIQFEGNMLISAYTLEFGEKGKTTTLKFVHPDSFTAFPTPQIKKDKKDSNLNG